jgi:hypothetical protein
MPPARYAGKGGGSKGGGGSDFFGSMWTSVVGGTSEPERRNDETTAYESGTELEPYSEVDEDDEDDDDDDDAGGRRNYGQDPRGGNPRTAYERNVLRTAANDTRTAGRLRDKLSGVRDNVARLGAATMKATHSFHATLSGSAADASSAAVKALRAEKRETGTEYVFVFDAEVKDRKKIDERRVIIGSLRQVGLIVELERGIAADILIAKVRAPFALLMWWAERKRLRVELKSFQEYLRLTLDVNESKVAAAAAAAKRARDGAHADGWEDFESDDGSSAGLDDGLGLGGRDSNWNGDKSGKTGLDRRDPGTAEYAIRQRELFQPFRSSQRQQLIDSLIQSRQFEGGANLDIETYVDSGRGGLLQIFPTHENEERERLYRSWTRISNLWRGIPVHDIRDYFGESIAFYFAFLSFYIRALALPSAFGLAVFVMSIVKLSSDNSLTPVYSGFTALWVTVFLEFWKRRRNLLSFKWDMTEFQQVDKVRPQFHGTLAPGFFAETGFVKLRKRDVAGIDIRYVRKEMYTKRWQQRLKLAVSYSGTFALAGIAIFSSMLLLWVRMWLIQENKAPAYQWEVAGNVLEFEVAAIVAGVLNGMAIALLNVISRWISYRLTAWENHRTESQHLHHLSIKLITFQVINSFFSLFYIAFFKQSATIFGRKDACSPDCMTELSYQLATIFLTREFVAIAQQGLLPMVLYAYTRSSFKRSLKKANRSIEEASPEEQQANMLPAEELIDDWVEVCISFGFICFVSAFPIVPLLSCIGTFIEIGLDTRNLLSRTQRARYAGANGIGVFYEVFNGLGLLAVITNGAWWFVFLFLLLLCIIFFIFFF